MPPDQDRGAELAAAEAIGAGNADLYHLAGAVDAELATPQPGATSSDAAQPDVTPALTLERELAGLFAMCGVGAGQFLPSVKKVLTEDACAQLGDAIAPVARKYGLEKYLLGFAWRVELQALMVVVPIGIALRDGIRHDLAAARAAAAAPAPISSSSPFDPNVLRLVPTS